MKTCFITENELESGLYLPLVWRGERVWYRCLQSIYIVLPFHNSGMHTLLPRLLIHHSRSVCMLTHIDNQQIQTQVGIKVVQV